MPDSSKVINIFESVKIIPVIVLQKPEDIIPLGELLYDNRLPVAEITFRSDAAAEGIRLLKKNIPEILVGAGTLLKIDSIKKAADAGADFFVSPGFNPKNAEYALKENLFMIPGVSNPSLVEHAMDMGLSLLKFFPASAAGGTDMLKALGAVYPDIQFIPTGGINENNINEYLSLPNVTACGGSWMVKKDMISSHQWIKIGELIKEAVRKTWKD